MFPELRMHGDMFESVCHFQGMVAKTGVSATIGPALPDFVAGIAKNRAESVFNFHAIRKIFPDFIQPGLGYIGPDAEQVRKTGEFQLSFQGVSIYGVTGGSQSIRIHRL